jgi:choline dehydrogenase-like flavoprotein
MPVPADIVVYGATAGGVIAAVAAARAGTRVILVEPGRHLGGMVLGIPGRQRPAKTALNR